MSELQCPQCGRKLAVDSGAAFCPFCGGALKPAQQTPEHKEVAELIAQADAMADPVKKHRLLAEGQARYPDSLALAEELLYLGRLHERNAKSLDFSVIKCYLLMIYLEPDTIEPDKIAKMRAELFDHPDLNRCLELSEDRLAFLNRYLTKLSSQFIELFLRGSSKYMRRYFGLGLDSRAPKLLAAPAARMIARMLSDGALDGTQRSLLAHAMYAAFTTQMNGDTQWLLQYMKELGVSLD